MLQTFATNSERSIAVWQVLFAIVQFSSIEIHYETREHIKFLFIVSLTISFSTILKGIIAFLVIGRVVADFHAFIGNLMLQLQNYNVRYNVYCAEDQWRLDIVK